MPEPGPGAAGTGPAPSAEDLKLIALARATRARVGAAEGAAVRDADGRTYTAATVGLTSLRLSAVQAAVAAAVSSAAGELAAAAVVTEGDPAEEPVLTELGCTALFVATPGGDLRQVCRLPGSSDPSGSRPGD